MKFHHIGLACPKDKVKKLILFFSLFKGQLVKNIFDNKQNANLYLIKVGNIYFEIVEGDIVRNFLKKGISIYHICFISNNLEKDINLLTNFGCILISPPKPASLFNYKKVCFLLTPFNFLIELLEE